MSSEVEIIRCWLKGLFKTIENADDVELKDLTLAHWRMDQTQELSQPLL